MFVTRKPTVSVCRDLMHYLRCCGTPHFLHWLLILLRCSLHCIYIFFYFLLPPLIVTSSSTGKFRKAVSQVSFSTCGSKKCCIFLVLYIHLPFVLFFFQDSEVKLFWKGEGEKKCIETFVLPNCELTCLHLSFFEKNVFKSIKRCNKKW